MAFERFEELEEVIAEAKLAVKPMPREVLLLAA
jgi:hypothetical protein